MTTNPTSKKTLNLLNNPRVSLLVHDWVSHRPPTRLPDPTREGSPPPQATRSSLASLLLNMNTSALSSISATINGEAVMVEHGSEEEKWCKERHLENNTFGDQAREEEGFWGSAPQAPTEGDGGTNCYIEGEEVRVVLVGVREGRIADWKGGVKDWSLATQDGNDRGRQTLANGSAWGNSIHDCIALALFLLLIYCHLHNDHQLNRASLCVILGELTFS